METRNKSRPKFSAAMAVQHVQRRTMGPRRGFGYGHARLASGTAEGVILCIRASLVCAWPAVVAGPSAKLHVV